MTGRAFVTGSRGVPARPHRGGNSGRASGRSPHGLSRPFQTLHQDRIEPFMKSIRRQVISRGQQRRLRMLGMPARADGEPDADVDIIDFSVPPLTRRQQEASSGGSTLTSVPNLADIYDESRCPDGWGPGITFDQYC